MEQFLIDYARSRNRVKRGGGRVKVSLTLAEGELNQLESVDTESIEILVESIRKLALDLPQAADVVRLRYISGLTIDQVADALEIDRKAVIKDWEYARAWLKRELTRQMK
jgi:RNA polymerase sigma factor (sigma-70 family)